MSVEKIIRYRNLVADRIDRKFGAFTEEAKKLHQKNLERLRNEIKMFVLKEKEKIEKIRGGEDDKTKSKN